MNFKLKLLQHLFKNQTQGLTIIEGLLAIIIVTILIMGIGPVLAFAAATRIQARRVELASQAATAYLDSVRAGSIKPPPIVASAMNPPSTPLTCPNNVDVYGGYCTDPTVGNAPILYCVDRNNNKVCNTAEDRKDFVIQAVRNPVSASNTYPVMVRVYRADSFADSIKLTSTQLNKKKSSVLAGGSGNKSAPVIELTTEIPPPK